MAQDSRTCLLHEDMVIMCLHVLQFSVLQALVNCSHVVCGSADVGNYVHELPLLLCPQYVGGLRHVVLVTSASRWLQP
jgi:hypothetical protein